MGVFDFELDYYPVIDYRVWDEVYFPYDPSKIEHLFLHLKEVIETDWRTYVDERSQLIEEVKGKYGWD